MPSLSALGEFRDSFGNIANEKNDVISKDMPFDPINLPDTEAPPFEAAIRTPPPSDDSAEESPGFGNFDFGAFVDSLPADTSPPPSIDDILVDNPPSDEGPPSVDDIFKDIDEPPLDDTPITDETAPVENALPDSDFQENLPDESSLADKDASIPEELLSGLSDEIEAAPADSQSEDFSGLDLGGETAGDESLSGEDSSDFDLGSASTGDEDLGGEAPGGFDQGGESTGAEDLGSENPDGSQDLDGDLPDFDFPDLEQAADTGSSDDGQAEDALDLGGERRDGTFSTESAPDDAPLSEGVSLPDLENTDEGIDLGGENAGGDFNFDETPPDTGSSEDDLLSGMDFSGAEAPPDFGTDSEMNVSQDAGAEDAGGLPEFEDTGDFSSESIELSNEPEAHIDDTLGGEDFALPGLDEIFDKSKIATITQPAPKKGLFKRKKTAVEEAPKDEEAEDIEEIQLSQEDLEKLLKTLSSYPLNLRIVCEEMIAEHVLVPQQLSKLIRLLVNGAYAKETALFAGEILGKQIVIPKSFEKSTGAALEAEKASFAYIFVHNFLPVFRIFALIAALTASVIYLGYEFIYIPFKAESIYQRGYERIFAGEYQRANELFHEAFVIHRKKKWFYQYAEGFRDQRRYMLAEAKYDELLRYYPRDKKGVLDYADLETNYLLNYDKANRILQQQLLDYAPNDYDGLLAAGDNFLAWADSNPSRFYDKYEDARYSYARLLEKYGWLAPVVERMMKYFIRTDNLKETLNLRNWFDGVRDRKLSPESIAELGGYLLDKQLASREAKGVPDPYVESIESVRAMLLQAVREKPNLPEPHYHLARYYKNLGNTYEERLTLENAIRAFNLAESEPVRRRLYRVDTHYRYANLLINNKEFFPAENELVRGIELYEDYLSRNLISPSVQLGQLYAVKGDLEYFVKSGNMQAALRDYHTAEKYGWSPPEIQYRMGAAYYQLENWGNSLEYLFKASADLPLNKRLLHALGNTAYKRGDYFAAQGYYNRLLDILENQRVRLPVLLPNDNPEFLELGERLMMARNNAGVVYEALADQTGNREYRSRALSLYAESARAWDSITRNPDTMVRMHLTDTPGAPGINLGFLNAGNAIRPAPDYKPEIFIRIDKDVLEPSRWEELAPFGGLVN